MLLTASVHHPEYSCEVGPVSSADLPNFAGVRPVTVGTQQIELLGAHIVGDVATKPCHHQSWTDSVRMPIHQDQLIETIHEQKQWCFNWLVS